MKIINDNIMTRIQHDLTRFCLETKTLKDTNALMIVTVSVVTDVYKRILILITGSVLVK